MSGCASCNGRRFVELMAQMAVSLRQVHKCPRATHRAIAPPGLKTIRRQLPFCDVKADATSPRVLPPILHLDFVSSRKSRSSDSTDPVSVRAVAKLTTGCLMVLVHTFCLTAQGLDGDPV